MLYVIIADDIENSTELRLQYSEQHRARIKTLVDQGRLFVAGPCPKVDGVEFSNSGFNGSVIIAEFDSLKDAQNWLDEDPFLVQGVYRQAHVQPFIKIFP